MPIGDFKPGLKLITTNALLVANAFVWFLIVFKTLHILSDNINPNLSTTILVFGVNVVSLAILAFVGSFVIDRWKKRSTFLSIWMLAGVFLSLLPLILNLSSISSVLLISIAFGCYFGVGMPAVMGYFSGHIPTESRAKIAGITLLLLGLVYSVLGTFLITNIIAACLVLSAIRLFGLLAFRGVKIKDKENEDSPKLRYIDILSNRSFIFYFVSWCMFSLVNYMTIPIQNHLLGSVENYNFLTNVLENIIMAVTAVTCGFIADLFGRKRLTMIGFIMLGIGYAGLGLFPDMASTGYFYVVADGVAWGIFNIVFLLVIWGDLAQGKNSDKLYFLGALPYVFSNFLKMVFVYFVPNISNLPLFSFASVFLFLAVLPLLYAPETLSEKRMKDRELKNYVEKAQKVAKKEEQKNRKQSKCKSIEKEDSLSLENNEEYKKAKELAEKYY